MRRVLAFFIVLLAVSCGGKDAPPASPATQAPPARAATEFPVPEWAKVAPEQVEAARKAGVPVAFENSIGMRFVLIPAGTFLMGSQETEEGWEPDERRHEVIIAEPYYMGVTEVTNAQYRRFRPAHDSGTDAGLGLNGDLQPAVRVNWFEAREFIAWLCAHDRSHPFRLPTEAEWEYACRAGTMTPYWCGGAVTTDDVNYNGHYPPPGAPKSLMRGLTLPVASLPPNPWGLYEVLGNALEWCSDTYDYLGRAVGASPQLGPPSRASRTCAVRGGSYAALAWVVRAGKRMDFKPDVRRVDLGFRICADLD